MNPSQPGGAKTPQRRRLLISPKFQGVFALYTLATTLYMIPIFIAANYYFFNLFARKAQSLGLPPEHELMRFVDSQQVLIVVVFVGVTAVVLSANLVLSYIFSNRIVGSLYRLTNGMNQANDLATATKVQPREADFFQEVLMAYNHFLDRIKP